MENINWALSIQAGILVSLVFLIFQVKEVVATLHVHFEQDHEMQRNHAEYLANLPSYHQFYKVMKDR